jgi:hypothetical protein
MNRALVDWLMAPEVPAEPLVLEDYLARPRWHQEVVTRGDPVEGYAGNCTALAWARSAPRSAGKM